MRITLINNGNARVMGQTGHGKHRAWTMENVLATLAGIRQQRVTVAGTEFYQVTQPNEEQQQILDLLKIRL